MIATKLKNKCDTKGIVLKQNIGIFSYFIYIRNHINVNSHMKKYIRWTGIAISVPFILFIILCILIYIPPIQNFMVRTATQYASEATGMDISIGRISLSFPLDLVVHQTEVKDKELTVLKAEKLTVQVQMWPLLKKQIELDGLELEKASVNTAGLIEGMTLKGNLGRLFVTSHGVALSPETAIVNQLQLEDTHLFMSLADTTAADTAASAPIYWKIQLEDIRFRNVSFRMQMPLDTLDMDIALQEASLKNGTVDLHESAYGAQSFQLKGSLIAFHSNQNEAPASGLDPAHLEITNLNLSLDSVRYAPQDIHAQIRNFVLKERSGLEILSTQGRLVSDSHSLHVPGLTIKTADSHMELKASMDWDAAEKGKEGSIYARFLADIGKNDLKKVLGESGDSLMADYPNQPIQIRAGVDGSLNRVKLSSLSLSIPETFSFQASGSVDYPIDSIRRNGNIDLALQTQNMDFLNKTLSGVHIPQGLQLDGKVSVMGSQLGTEMHLLTENKEGKVNLNATYQLQNDAYDVQMHIDSLNVSDFIAQDSLYCLSASMSAQGQGFDFFSPQTLAAVKGGIEHLQYGKYHLSGIDFEADYKENTAHTTLLIDNELMNAQATFLGKITSQKIQGSLQTDINQVDLQALKMTENWVSPSLRLESKFQTDLNSRHRLEASIKDIRIKTVQAQYTPKDIHAGVNLSPDSIRSFVNAGDLVFWLRSQNSLDKLTGHVERLIAEVSSQWEKKQIQQKVIREILPSAQLGMYAGTNNPLYNFLSANHIKYDKLSVTFRTSPQEGINGKADLYGFRTDSLKLDTIYFHTQSDTADIRFYSGVKALPNKWQEGFEVALTSRFGVSEGDMNIVYLNEKKEQGVNLGIKALLQKEGVSLHILPYNPTLVYRTFQANPDNYIYLSDRGRIHANLNLFDSHRSGLSLYSTPDSLAQQDLTLALNQINIAEFRRIIPYMPDIAGFINAEMHYIQTEEDMQVSAEMSVNQLAYNKQAMGDWGMSMVYLPQTDGTHRIDGFMTLNEQEIVTLNGSYRGAQSAQEKDFLKANMELLHLPLNLANAFIPDRMALLSGDLDGKLSISGATDSPVINGKLNLDSVGVNVPQASLQLRMEDQPLVIDNSKLKFNRFKIFTKGQTPFVINGDVDLNTLGINLQMNARNFELLNAKRTKEGLVYGKLYIDFNSTIKGNPDDLKMRGNANILGSSNFTYVLKDSPLTIEDRLNETVTFVNFSDTLAAPPSNLATLSLGGIDMLMTLHIDEAVQARVDLNEDGSNYMLLEGGGDLSFQYQPDGNMVLNGRYSLMSGEMKYQLPVIPLKTFHIQEGSYIEWTGNLMNPKLNIKATEKMRAAVTAEGGNSRNVNFDVGVSITNRLENLAFTFTLEAPEDGTMQNELASKSAEERNKLAVTMLVTGLYLADGNSLGKSSSSNVLNNFLQGQINKMAGKALNTIDINLGVETNEQSETGTSSTDYSFQFAKRFWNNRFQVVIGGRISTGNNVQQDESFIDNVSLEYRLDKSGTRYVRIFHDKNYESVLDGEVIETGAGVVLRKKVSKLGELFIFRTRKKESQRNQEKEEKDEDK